MKKTVYAVIIMAILMTSASISYSAFSITPSVSVREEYNDNIFLARNDEEDDFITTIYPKVELKYSPSRVLDLDLEYGLRFNFYSRHSGLNDTSLSETQVIDMEAQVRPVNRFFIDITDDYEKVQVDVRDPVAEDNVFFNKTERNTLFVSPYMIYPLTSKLSAKPGYSYTNVWHRDDGFNDYDIHAAFLELDNRFTTQINGAVRYEYSVYNNLSDDETSAVDSEYNRHEASVRVEYQLRSDLKVYGEAGRAWTDFEEENNVETNFWDTGAEYTFGSSTLGAEYSNSLHDSPTSGAFKRQRADITFETGRDLTVSVNPYYSYDKYLQREREDKILGVALDLSKRLTEKLSVSLDGGHERQKFLPEIEKVRTTSIGGGIDYRISRSITAGAGYRYNDRESDTETNEFDNNILWLRAEVIF